MVTGGGGQLVMRRVAFTVLVVGLAIPLLVMLRATASQSKIPECEAVGGLIVPIATGGTRCISPGSGKSFKDCGGLSGDGCRPSRQFRHGISQW